MRDSILKGLSPRPADSHKGDFGRALLIGGSRGMAGAIGLAGMAAVCSGAGLVRLAVPDCCLDTVAGYSPCYMLLPMCNDAEGRIEKVSPLLTEFANKSDCIAIGPGLGRSTNLDQFALDILAHMKMNSPDASLVIDADALNALATNKNWRQLLTSRMVLTPHPGEWFRLTGIPASLREQQEQSAIEVASQTGCTILLKGQHTLITNGIQAVHNQTGTPAISTGGSGDVLTGVIAALICQGKSVFDAARLGADVHGLAGQLAADKLGSHVVIPTELIEFLRAAFQRLN